MKSNSQTALEVVLRFLNSYSKEDVEACLSAFSTTRELMLLGTNDNEVFSSLQEIREAFSRDFASMSNIRFGDIRHSHVESGDTLATVLVELPITFETEGKQEQTLFRYALTLVTENGNWKIYAGMASVPFSAGTYSF